MTRTTLPRKRNERRAQTPAQPTIPLSQPSRSTPVATSTFKPKTLYEIAAERQQALLRSSSPATPPTRTSTYDLNPPHTTLRINPDGTLSAIPSTLSSSSRAEIPRTSNPPNDSAAREKDPLGPLVSALFLSSTLSMLHFTLDVLVYHQYRQTILWSDIAWRTAGALPLLLLLLTTTNTLLPPSHSLPRLRIPTRQILFLALALLSGTYLLHVMHDAAYYAVLKRAPAIGTLWVWSVVELELKWALVSVLGVGAWGWWMGYGVF